MMAPTPETERSYDLIDILFIFWRAVMILLAAVIGVYGYWTAVAAESVKCAGMQWIAGYRTGVVTLWVMPSLGILAAGWTVVFFRRAKITELLRLAPYCETLFSFGAIRVSVGAVLFYGSVIASPFMFGKSTEFLMVRYHTISGYCQTDTVSSRLNDSARRDHARTREKSLTDETHAKKESQPKLGHSGQTRL